MSWISKWGCLEEADLGNHVLTHCKPGHKNCPPLLRPIVGVFFLFYCPLKMFSETWSWRSIVQFMGHTLVFITPCPLSIFIRNTTLSKGPFYHTYFSFNNTQKSCEVTYNFSLEITVSFPPPVCMVLRLLSYWTPVQSFVFVFCFRDEAYSSIYCHWKIFIFGKLLSNGSLCLWETLEIENDLLCN